VSYSQGDGFDVSYPDFPGSPDATYEARVDSPSADEDRQRSGTTAEIDAEVRVRDDTGQQWTGWGEESDAPAHIRDTATGIRYEVSTHVDKHNGLTVLEVVEV
jgi:hypothetical protein